MKSKETVMCNGGDLLMSLWHIGTGRLAGVNISGVGVKGDVGKIFYG